MFSDLEIEPEKVIKCSECPYVDNCEPTILCDHWARHYAGILNKEYKPTRIKPRKLPDMPINR
jgi:hypothetical protein